MPRADATPRRQPTSAGRTRHRPRHRPAVGVTRGARHHLEPAGSARSCDAAVRQRWAGPVPPTREGPVQLGDLRRDHVEADLASPRDGPRGIPRPRAPSAMSTSSAVASPRATRSTASLTSIASVRANGSVATGPPTSRSASPRSGSAPRPSRQRHTGRRRRPTCDRAGPTRRDAAGTRWARSARRGRSAPRRRCRRRG